MGGEKVVKNKGFIRKRSRVYQCHSDRSWADSRQWFRVQRPKVSGIHATSVETRWAKAANLVIRLWANKHYQPGVQWIERTPGNKAMTIQSAITQHTPMIPLETFSDMKFYFHQHSTAFTPASVTPPLRKRNWRTPEFKGDEVLCPSWS